MDKNNAVQTLDRMQQQTGVRLNEIQRASVLHTEGPLLVLASPGSGKTTTLIMRIGYLLVEKRVPAARIKAVTFSRAAAEEMRLRFERFFPELQAPPFGTIHSFAFEVVRRQLQAAGTVFEVIEGRTDVRTDGRTDRRTDTEKEVLNKTFILRRLYQQLNGSMITDDQLDELMVYISYVKNNRLPREAWGEVTCSVRQAEALLEAYEQFKQHGTGRLLLDFDDMLTRCAQLLEEDEALLRRYQRRYSYLLTDESQDTSRVQHAIIELLAGAHRNLCVFADDDQSLYSWRGADPGYLLKFREVYPEARLLYMTRNYRSSRDIVEVANRFIKRNVNRYPKEMTTTNPPHEPIRTRILTDYRQQTPYVMKEIGRAADLSEVAVLFRNNASAIALINALERRGIPFVMKDTDNRFFSHWVVEDVLNFMRMTFTDKRPELFEKIYAKCNAFISRQQMNRVLGLRNDASVFDNLLALEPLPDYRVKTIVTLKETFEQMRGMPPRQAIKVIRQRLGYERTLEELSEKFGFRKEHLLGILNTLEEIAGDLKTMTDFALRLKRLAELMRQSSRRRPVAAASHGGSPGASALGEAGGSSGSSGSDDLGNLRGTDGASGTVGSSGSSGSDTKAVTLSTLHSAKGLEFDTVYIVDLIDGVLPSKEDKEQPELMEEAVRLFYVGMTRARKRLELLAYTQRDGARVQPSPFVAAVQRLTENAGNAGQGKDKHRKQGKRLEQGTPIEQDKRLEKGGHTAQGTRLENTAQGKQTAQGKRRVQDIRALKPGLHVQHRVFGKGEIVALDEAQDKLTLRFGSRVKELALSICLERQLLSLSTHTSGQAGER